MTRKEEIIDVTLKLASQYGLKAVSLGQIAEEIGIRKPSLYNHFKSKEELVSAMYAFLREQARSQNTVSPDMTTLLEENNLEEILMGSLSKYLHFLSDQKMLCFFKVLYSERSTSPMAAQIMLEETERMIQQTKALFYALVVHGEMKNEQVDIAALSYAMTIHSLIDRQMDRMAAKASEDSEIPEDMRAYVTWFSHQMEVEHHA